ncbi:triose-phosphate isomerase [Anaerococcus kampingiae]|uniref:Triose-phosphate isomerase n=1 Tax=Anaerococcus kampingae TaxID=3115614 RepID=A0ABW9MD34_9FIRM
MKEKIIRKPFFIFNPKSYLNGKELYELTEVAEELATKYKDKASILVTGPFIDLANMVKLCKNAHISAQHLDEIEPGRGMGHISVKSVSDIGVKAAFLNHAEHQLTLAKLTKVIDKCKEYDIETVVCADSLAEARSIAVLKPDVILCEPTELIGTGKVSDDSYIEETNRAIREIDDSILIMQAAGISTPDDVYRTISLGADGTGCTSGIVKAENPKQMLIDMVDALVRAYESRSN